MKTVITYGTFDIFHAGHVRLLQRARELGERLVVGVSTDEFNAEKGKRCVFPYEERVEIVGSMRCVDEVFPESGWAQKREDIQRHSADVFVIGDDWKGRFDDLQDSVDVIYLPRTPSVSTTEIRNSLRGVSMRQVEDLRAAVEVMAAIVKGIS